MRIAIHEKLDDRSRYGVICHGNDDGIPDIAVVGAILGKGDGTFQNPLPLDIPTTIPGVGISTLLVFRSYVDQQFYCLIRHRSSSVAVSPNMYHVIPAGMLETENRENCSVETNVWRELLEEVYSEKEQRGTGQVRDKRQKIETTKPIPVLRSLLSNGRAEFSLTGLCSSLLHLGPEICTVLFVPDPSFHTDREMKINWEYKKHTVEEGGVAWRWDEIGDLMATMDASNTVQSCAACLHLGVKWLAHWHGTNLDLNI